MQANDLDRHFYEDAKKTNKPMKSYSTTLIISIKMKAIMRFLLLISVGNTKEKKLKCW